MTDEMIALARRAVACKGWRWMPGMLDQFGRRVMCVWPDDLGIKWSHLLDNRVPRDAECIPDLTDPATLGCLLALVREAWGDPHASVWYDSEYWQSGNRWAWHAKEQSRVDYDTEAEALVAALESAP